VEQVRLKIHYNLANCAYRNTGLFGIITTGTHQLLTSITGVILSHPGGGGLKVTIYVGVQNKRASTSPPSLFSVCAASLQSAVLRVVYHLHSRSTATLEPDPTQRNSLDRLQIRK
jgi:hypothetical protein